MKADSRTEEEVRAALTKFADAYRKRDLRALLECFATDADVVLFGTGADEKRLGPDQLRTQVERDWAQSESAALKFAWMSVSAAGSVAWAAADGAFGFRAGGLDGELAVRATFVLEKRAGRWFVVHAHFSTPAAGQQDGESF